MGNMFLAALAGWSCLVSAAAESANYLNLDLREDRFLGEVQHSTQESNYTQGSARLNLEPSKPDRTWRYKLNSRAQGAFESRDEFYFGVPEAFVAMRSRPLLVTVGRQRRAWSRLDEYFHLGVWQPELRWDYLNPEQEGLTGIFVDLTLSRKMTLSLFTSPVNIPDQGPQYRLKDGRFYSANRWFQQPSGALGLFQDTPYASNAPLYFKVQRPSDQELFFNPSLGGALEYTGDSGFWVRAAYAYKPRNQIHLGIECSNCANIGAPVPLEITAVIHPKIIMHHVATVETGVDRVDDRAWMSLTAERPDRSGFPQEYEEAPIDDALIAGAAYQHFAGNWIGRPSWFQYSYMKVFRLGSATNSSSLNEDQVRSSMDRYPLKEVAAFDWKIRLFEGVKQRMHWTNRYSYSVPEKGGWLSSQLEFQQGEVTWLAGCDILGSRVDEASDEAGLFTRYRSNDRVFGGVSYVF